MFVIREATVEDALRVSEIYNYYVLKTSISFETEAVCPEDMAKRIDGITSGGYPYYVYEIDGVVAGYCYLGSWKGRRAYSATAELSIYVDHEKTCNGIGGRLMKHLLDNTDRVRFHTVIACISLPNELSVTLHEKFGFNKISHFREVGFKFGGWLDVGHWQLIL